MTTINLSKPRIDKGLANENATFVLSLTMIMVQLVLHVGKAMQSNAEVHIAHGFYFPYFGFLVVTLHCPS